MPRVFDGDNGKIPMYVWESALEASIRIPCISFLDGGKACEGEGEGGLVQVGTTVRKRRSATAAAGGDGSASSSTSSIRDAIIEELKTKDREIAEDREIIKKKDAELARAYEIIAARLEK